jgi:hypothetical protein
MIAHWMNDPVHGTKAGYSKLAMKLAERVEADLVPKAITKRTTQKKRAASPEAGSSGTSYPRNIRGRGGMTPATHSVRGRTRTREGGGSPTSHAAAAAAAVVEAAEAAEEAARPTTTTRASLLCTCTFFVQCVVVYILLFLIVLCQKKS